MCGEINACGSACVGAGTALSSPSTRMRTVSPLRIGSDVDIARSKLDFCFFQKVIDRARYDPALRRWRGRASFVDALLDSPGSQNGR